MTDIIINLQNKEEIHLAATYRFLKKFYDRLSTEKGLKLAV